MTNFQKEAIIATVSQHGPQDSPKFAGELFLALEKNNVDYEPLVIPVFDLELERFIPVGYASKFIEVVRMDKLMHAAVVFDLFIPSKMWIANISTFDDKNGYLKQSVKHSVWRCLQSVRRCLNPDCDYVELIDHVFYNLYESGEKLTLEGIIEDAVIAYLDKKGLKHPLDCNASLRFPYDANGMLLPSDKIDSFINSIKK